MRTRYTMAALILLASALPAAAQTPIRVDHRDPSYTAGFFDVLQPGAPVADRAGWTWQHDGAGWSQMPTTTPAPVRVTAPPLVAADGPTWADADCQGLNPYIAEEAERLAACGRRPGPADRVPAFTVGAVYSYGYSEIRARILGVTLDTDGVQVVTLRWLQDGQGLAAVRTPATPNGESAWSEVR